MFFDYNIFIDVSIVFAFVLDFLSFNIYVVYV